MMRFSHRYYNRSSYSSSSTINYEPDIVTDPEPTSIDEHENDNEYLYIIIYLLIFILVCCCCLPCMRECYRCFANCKRPSRPSE